jgi:Nucleotidyl transferase of unknown function (DUF2204)
VLERVDLERRLPVDLPKKGLAEVRNLRAREPADEPLRTDDADLELPDLEDHMVTLEDVNASRFEHRHDLVAATRVMVVVAEHGHNRDGQAPARVGEHACLLGEAMGREIACKENQIALVGDRGECPRNVLSERFGAVDIRCRHQSNRGRHAERDTRQRGSANSRRGYLCGHEPRSPSARSRRGNSWFPRGPLPSSKSRRVPHIPPRSWAVGPMSSSDRQELEDLVATMKRGAAALRDAQVPFMLGGGLAAWARGGPRTTSDVDFLIKEEDAEQALQALVDAGMQPERPTEEWLLKAYDGDILVDLIFRPSGGPIGREQFERASELEVLGQSVLVASIDDVLVTKLLALSEQEPDFQSVLAVSRALREQIDWEFVRAHADESPFARAFFTLAEELGIVEPPSPIASVGGR